MRRATTRSFAIAASAALALGVAGCEVDESQVEDPAMEDPAMDGGGDMDGGADMDADM